MISKFSPAVSRWGFFISGACEYLSRMMKPLKSLLLGVFLVAVTTTPDTLQAQSMPFQNYSIQSGLSQSVVTSLLQDNGGYVWIGTEFGLNRFNRYEFEQFFEEDGLSHNGIVTLYEDRDNRLLVGTEAGLVMYDQGQFVTVPGTELLEFVQVNAIFQDDQNGLWVGTESAGLYLFFQDSFVTFTESSGLPSNEIRAVNQMPDGQILVATRDGVALIYGGIIRKTWNMENGLSESRSRDILVFPDNTFWIGTRNGISIFANGRYRYLTNEDGLIDSRVTSLEHDGYGGVWIATEGGVSHYRNGTFKNYTDLNGLSNNIVNELIVDSEGNQWFGTYGGGVDMLPGEKFTHFTVSEGLLSNMITSFEQDRQGDIWISTFGGGVSVLRDQGMVNYTTSDGLNENRVFTLFKSSSGSIYAGTQNGVSRYENGRFVDDPISTQLPDGRVRTILEAPNGDFYVGTYGGGIVQFRNGRRIRVWDTDSGLTDNIIMKMILRDDESIWAATYGGVNIIEPDGSTRAITVDDGILQNNILSIMEDEDDCIWIGSFAGLTKIDGDTIRNYTPAQGLQNSVVYFIGQDESGMMWLGTVDGLIRFDHTIDFDIDDPNRIKDTVKFKRYTVESGLTSNEMNSNAVFTDSDGNLWMGSVEGVTQFRWRLDRVVDRGPKVHIERIRLFDGYVDVNRNNTFRHDQNFLGFEFIGLSYSNPTEVLYEYRLSGIDPDWRKTTERVVRYTTLPDGEFRFQVRARNADGYWSPQIASIMVTIAPPFWKSWWFILIMIVAVILTSGFLYNYYRISRLVDLERIRIRIASDLHDDVGASLTEIALNADFLQATQKDSKVGESLKQIGDMSRRIVTTMDDIVWSIDARNDTFGDLLDRMQDYATNVLAPTGIEPIFHFNGFDSSKIMPLEIRQNVYLIFKESVNNAAKHSKASRIEITFNRTEHSFELVIADNGVGMPEHIRAGGHGLKNMKLRATRIHAHIDFEHHDGLTIRLTGKGI
jgi:ligand-binding sensor domain-containing protein/two-component sensor histidine kinase